MLSFQPLRFRRHLLACCCALLCASGLASAQTPAASAAPTLVLPDGGQYYYNQYENALNGNYDPDQIMYGGSRLVVENPGTGPVKVRANDGTHVWVGTRNNPAAIRRG